MPLEIPILVAALLALDVLAHLFGHDSRETWIGEWRSGWRGGRLARRFWWRPEEDV